MPIPDPIAFTIFGVDIRWYGVLIACAIGIAVALTCLRAPKHNLTADQMLDVLIFAIPGGILGARIYYVIFEWSYYGQHLDQIGRVGRQVADAAAQRAGIHQEQPMNGHHVLLRRLAQQLGAGGEHAGAAGRGHQHKSIAFLL